MKMLLLVIFTAIGLSLFSTTIVQAEEQKPWQQTYSTPEAKEGEKVLCPVMNTPIIVTKETLAVKIKDKNYYVCCQGCVGKLKADPDKYLTPKEAAGSK